jgi:ankyrin repeat protein
MSDGPIINLPDELSEQLFLACAHSDVSEVARLLDAGVDPNVKHKEEYTPIFLTIRKCATASERQINLQVLELLIARGASVNARQKSDFLSPLLKAAEVGDPEIAKILIDNGAVIDCDYWDSSRPLHVAAQKNNIEVARVLIENGANVNIRNTAGNTPLYEANLAGHITMAKLLVDNGAEGQVVKRHWWQ